MFENEPESRPQIKLDPLSFLGSSSMHTLDPGLLSTKIYTRKSPGILVHQLMTKFRSASGLSPGPSLLQHKLHDLRDIFKTHTASQITCQTLGAKKHISEIGYLGLLDFL